jgi:hypothetical protein
MHAGWMHLLGNMLFFFLSGPFIEDVYGRVIFPLFYLASGVVAALTHAGAHPGSVAALVGASGAIAGVMGAFLVRFGRRRIRFLFLPILLPQIRTQFLMPAFVVLPFWMGQQVLFAHAAEDGSGTAWWAHIGGFAFGMIVALALRVARVEERFISPAIQRATTYVADPSLERIVDARVAGDLQSARAEVDGLLRRQPNSLDGWREAYELALVERDPTAVGRAASRLLDLCSRAGERSMVADLLHDPRWREVQPVSALMGLTAASHLEREGDARSALELLEEITRLYPQDPSSLRAHVRRGELLTRAGDSRGARLAFEAARAHPAYGPPWTEIVEPALGGGGRRSAGATNDG